MGKKIISFLISTRFTAILFILFPLSMGVGTFIESYYNTTTAKILIYNAKWFEIPIDDHKFLTYVEKVASVLAQSILPEASSKCNFCKYRNLNIS